MGVFVPWVACNTLIEDRSLRGLCFSPSFLSRAALSSPVDEIGIALSAAAGPDVLHKLAYHEIRLASSSFLRYIHSHGVSE